MQKEEISVKKIYFWNFMGSVCNAASSMILLMLVTRTADDMHADIFSIGFAIAQQFATIGTFQVRNYQATDVKEKFSFRDYFSFRIFTGSVMLFVSLVYVLIKGYDFEKGIIVFLICLLKVVESVSDVYQGFFQQKERLDLAGKILTLRASVTCSVFGVTMLLFSNMLLAIIFMIFSSVICYFVFERKKYQIFSNISRKQVICIKEQLYNWYEIAKQCVPLFINGYLIMAIYNAPKNAIDNLLKINTDLVGMQTDYNILFMPASVINLLLIFLRPYMTHMAYAWTQKQEKVFRKFMYQIVFGVTSFSIVVVIGAYILGIFLLELLYGRDLGAYRLELMLIMIGGGFSSLATVLDNIITVIRKQHLLVIGYIVSWITVVLIAGFMVEEQQILGAASAFLISMIVLAVTNAIILLRSLKKGENN